MRIFILVVNYSLIIFSFLALLSLFEEFDIEVIYWVSGFLFVAIPNIIYAHITKPIDLEKEELKKEVDSLKKDLWI
jgi:inner membrane protein involved in colicin E2 resistance